ncbi:hypothetical protein GOV09_00010 [Candidatus Woesearchaeota archaeon]|nr:hypothetical protein [Candidatus Woesearchaeota archaeon]
MNKKGYGQYIVYFFVLIIILNMLPVLTDFQCERYKGPLSDCEAERNKLQQQLNECRDQFAQRVNETQDLLEECQRNVVEWQKAYDEAVTPITEYYFIQLFDDKIVLFNIFVIYHIQMILLSLSLGIALTVKLFQIDVKVSIELLSKEEQKKFTSALRKFLQDLRSDIRDYIAEHPWGFAFWAFVIIIITNIIGWIF